ncbi:MAG TPA: orotidine-5'-phosphate decarboxylase [Acidimicrobiia bacterium]|nr:orotidine-5'-phosphate decarboxylase [Acidimicrobiia bacterium]
MNPLLVALDFASAEEAVRAAKPLASHVGGFKVGLELLLGPGPATVAAIRQLGVPVFADAKLHDIPRTVERAARHLGRLGARWVTVHAAGGLKMIEAAVSGLREGAGGREAGVLGVTVLTSMEPSELATVGVGGTPGKQTARLARLAAAAGAEGVVCAVRELGDVGQVAPRLLKVTPGIRPAGADRDDQARVATPAEAVRRGADLIVVGRPITRAKDPVAAARAIIEELAAAGDQGSSAARV